APACAPVNWTTTRSRLAGSNIADSGQRRPAGVKPGPGPRMAPHGVPWCEGRTAVRLVLPAADAGLTCLSAVPGAITGSCQTGSGEYGRGCWQRHHFVTFQQVCREYQQMPPVVGNRSVSLPKPGREGRAHAGRRLPAGGRHTPAVRTGVG